MIDEHIIDMIAKDKITRVTMQLWRAPHEFNNKRREYLTQLKPHGTGILLEVNGFKLLITAKHVCDGISEDNLLYFQISKESFLSIEGEVILIDDTEDIGIDLAIITLSTGNVSEIQKIHNFLPFKQLRPGIEFKGGEPLIAAGFPELATKIDKIELSVVPSGKILFSKACQEKVYDKYKRNKDIFIGFDYSGRETHLITNEKSKKLGPEGISGGGLWVVWEEPFLGDTKTEYGLVGILTEYNNGLYHVLWANRIELLIDSINRNFLYL